MKVTVFFAWYDMWIGMYIDRARQVAYICPLPCLVFKAQKGDAK